MDYEKKYNDALERARALWQEAIEKEYPNDYLKDYETIFPELAESEDERIRRTLVEYFGPKVQLDFVRGIPIQKIRDWLEKQKEQKQTDLPAGFYYIDLNGNRYYSKEFRYGDMKLKVGEQKPVLTAKEAWKEMRLEVYAQASGNRHEPNYSDDSTKMFSLCDIDEIFEKIGNSTVEQKPAEWSEEDKKDIAHIIRILDDCYAYGKHDLSKTDHENLVNKLKSLRPSWKPSEEQEEPEYYQHFDPDC